MLEHLKLELGQQVLEIGAGTGYNAALMAHVVGPTGHVTTVDLDHDLVAGAQAHLASAEVDNVAVVGAAMRKLLHIVYGVLTSGQPFDPQHGGLSAVH